MIKVFHLPLYIEKSFPASYNLIMLITASHLIDTPVLSMQAASAVGQVSAIIVDPTSFQIIAFYLIGPGIGKSTNILDSKSIREYSSLGMVIDSTDELVAPTDVVKISKAIALNFSLIGLKVETKKGSKLGHVIDFTITNDNFSIQQIIVKRPLVKSFSDPELTIPRHEITEVTDTKVIVKDEEDIIRKKAAKEDFIPNFVNPFRKSEQAHAPARTETPADIDIE